MRFSAYFFMIAFGVSLLSLGAHEPHNRPSDPAWLAQLKKPGVVLTYLNPFATLEPSIISSGHAKYFGEIDELNSEQKKDLKQFVTRLIAIKIGITVAYFIIPRLVGLENIFAKLILVSFGLPSLRYIRSLYQFEKKLDESIRSQKSKTV